MSICPGCGRCSTCGKPRPLPTLPWPNVPYPPPQFLFSPWGGTAIQPKITYYTIN